jgi:hypothetical protein
MHKRPRLTQRDRWFWILLNHVWKDRRTALVIVQPDTVVRWHRERFRRFWARLSKILSYSVRGASSEFWVNILIITTGHGHTLHWRRFADHKKCDAAWRHFGNPAGRRFTSSLRASGGLNTNGLNFGERQPSIPRRLIDLEIMHLAFLAAGRDRHAYASAGVGAACGPVPAFLIGIDQIAIFPMHHALA